MIIDLDSEMGKEFGFTSDKFSGWLGLGEDNDIYISCIFAIRRGQGDFRRLVKTILSKGYTVKIPTPLGKMAEIVMKNGYKKTEEYFPEAGEMCEVWVLKCEKEAVK
jgi:hypothetical protein